MWIAHAMVLCMGKKNAAARAVHKRQQVFCASEIGLMHCRKGIFSTRQNCPCKNSGRGLFRGSSSFCDQAEDYLACMLRSYGSLFCNCAQLAVGQPLIVDWGI